MPLTKFKHEFVEELGLCRHEFFKQGPGGGGATSYITSQQGQCQGMFL